MVTRTVSSRAPRQLPDWCLPRALRQGLGCLGASPSGSFGRRDQGRGCRFRVDSCRPSWRDRAVRPVADRRPGTGTGSGAAELIPQDREDVLAFHQQSDHVQMVPSLEVAPQRKLPHPPRPQPRYAQQLPAEPGEPMPGSSSTWSSASFVALATFTAKRCHPPSVVPNLALLVAQRLRGRTAGFNRSRRERSPAVPSRRPWCDDGRPGCQPFFDEIAAASWPALPGRAGPGRGCTRWCCRSCRRRRLSMAKASTRANAKLMVWRLMGYLGSV